MDDFVISNLHEARNEWCSHLVNVFTPLVIEGVKSIFNESWKLCVEQDEVVKYLMTFQNLLCRVPKWNSIIVEEERKRIIERSGCNYLEDLITCVHIIQLKVLTSIRVGNKQKKIDIAIPKLDAFIHKVYIHVARKVYMNIYLFEKNITPLQQQKNSRELEMIVQECILTTVRESVPVEEIIRAYMDESVEQEEEVSYEHVDIPVVEAEGAERSGGPGDAGDASSEPITLEEKYAEKKPPEVTPVIQNLDNEPVVTRLSFNDIDSVLNGEDEVEKIVAPKSIERLEEISTARAIQRKLEEEEVDDDRIQIHTGDSIDLSSLGIMDLQGGSVDGSKEDLLGDIMVL
jgi:hypothetical protein